ncbi:hypothetical protein FOCC_FOCC008190 [Frankliniella occidentalis]|nr:hypothetical protein FOCC_FOCC008190 [Frankliniella occidentalis]
MEPANRRDRGRARPRYGPYKRYAERGGIPKSTYYDIQRRNRNRNDMLQEANVHGNVMPNVNDGPVDAAFARGHQNIQVNMPYAGDEALFQDNERPVEMRLDDNHDNGNDELFANEFVNREEVHEIDAVEEAPVLTVPPKNIEIDENLVQNVTENLGTTKFEVLLMVLSFALRHGLTSVAITDLLKMINVILGSNNDGILPTSRYMFKKIFSSDMEFKFHMYCPDCMIYIGEITQELKERKTAPCRRCAKEVKVPGMQSKDFFATLPVGSQIADFLEGMDDVADQLNYRWEREPSENIRDIYDGEIYKNLMKDGKFLSRRYNLSLTFSTDGATVFNSGCTSMWPIFFRLNELKPDIRFKDSNCMLAGLWFGKKEPPMGMYLRSFLQECQNLYDHGITWRARQGEIIKSKIITLNCVLDSGAKYMLQATKKFNGYQSCPYCDHPGVTYNGNLVCKWPMNEHRVRFEDKGFSYSIEKYDRIQDEIVQHNVYDRNNEEMRRDMAVAETRRREDPSFQGYRGFRCESAMCYLPFFDVCLGFQIDYMHNSLLGNCDHLAKLWFDSHNKDEPFYLGLKLAQIDQRLLALTPPTCISRRTRTIRQWKDWHANEWRSWLLYYSLPCLKGILPTVYYKHHCVLVSAIHMLLKDDITPEALDTAAEYLADYVNEFQVLYGEEEMFFNVHLLLHLAKSVLHWGPLWCYGMFSFENSNKSVLQLVKGSTGVASQIVSKYSISKFLPHLLEVYQVSDEVATYCGDLMCYKRVRDTVVSGGVTLFGRPRVQQLTNEERCAFRASGIELTDQFYGYMIQNAIKFSCTMYNRGGQRSDNTIACLSDGTYVKIIRIILQVTNGEVFLLVKSESYVKYLHGPGLQDHPYLP